MVLEKYNTKIKVGLIKEDKKYQNIHGRRSSEGKLTSLQSQLCILNLNLMTIFFKIHR